jgi:hypothetical protein
MGKLEFITTGSGGQGKAEAGVNEQKCTNWDSVLQKTERPAQFSLNKGQGGGLLAIYYITEKSRKPASSQLCKHYYQVQVPGESCFYFCGGDFILSFTL